MFADNPQSFMNGFLSGMRNSIITVSLGIGIYSFSRNFKKKSSRDIMKRLSVLVYLFSFLILFNSNLLLRNYLSSLNDKEKGEMPKYINFTMWKRYEYLGWFLSLIILILFILGSYRDIMGLFNL